jgi:hypothetical protein
MRNEEYNDPEDPRKGGMENKKAGCEGNNKECEKDDAPTRLECREGFPEFIHSAIRTLHSAFSLQSQFLQFLRPGDSFLAPAPDLVILGDHLP